MSSKKGSFILTGCNGGLGKAVVAEFLQSSNASSYKGQFAVRKLSTATSLQAVLATSPSATGHEIITIDLSNLSSVRKATKEIHDRVKSGKIPPIRALLLNAALQHMNGQTYTDDGLESNFAVNTLPISSWRYDFCRVWTRTSAGSFSFPAGRTTLLIR